MTKSKRPFIVRSIHKDDVKTPSVIFNNLVYGASPDDALERFLKSHPYHRPVAPPEPAPWGDDA